MQDGILMGLAYIVSRGNIAATIIWFAITTGATAGLSYYKEKETEQDLLIIRKYATHEPCFSAVSQQ